MSEKYLTESDWKKFSKGKNYKDAGLLKAFAALEKAEKSSADEQLEALDEIDKQGQILLKAHKGDEELADYIDDDMDRALAKQRKAAEQAAKAESEKDGDEEEETPALLTKKMIPVIRQVRKGETVRVMIATAGKDTVLLMSRKAIPGTRKKLLMTELGVTGGVKFINGDCLFEENAYTFVVQAGAGGLAKKLKAALLKQVELRLKVRVRGEDPADVDDDGEEAEDEGGEGESSEGEGEQQPTPPSQEQRDYEARWTALEPGYLAALKNPQVDASKLRALHGFAQGKSATGDYKAALQALDGLAKMINAPAGGGIPPAPPRPTGEKPTPTPVVDTDPDSLAFKARLAALGPQVQAAAAMALPTLQDIRLKISEAGVFSRKKEFGAANGLLDDADKLLRAANISANIPPAPPLPTGGPTAKPPGPPADPDTAAFNARLTALMPQIKEALAAAGEHAQDIKLKASEAGVFARKKEFASANALLDEAEALLKQGLKSVDSGESSESEESEDTGTPEADEARWMERFTETEARYLKILATNPADATRLRAVMGYANDQAADEQYAKALAGLDQLEKLLDAAEAAGTAGDTGYEGLTAYRKTLLDFRKAVTDVEGRIAGLKSAIPKQLPAEDELATELADALHEYNTELLDAVDAAMNASENKDSPVTKDLVAQIDRYLKEVASNPLIKHVDANPFGVAMNIEKTLGDALAEIRDAMPAFQ